MQAKELVESGNYERAKQLYTLSLRISETYLGNESLAVSLTHRNLGHLHLEKTDYLMAIEEYEKALLIAIKHSGLNAQITLELLSYLGRSYIDGKKYTQGISTLSVPNNSNGNALDHHHMMNSIKIAYAYRMLGDFQLAEFEIDMALIYMRKKFGTNSASSRYGALIYLELGQTYLADERYEEAVSAFQESITIVDNFKLGEILSFQTTKANSLKMLGYVYSKTNNKIEADKAFRAAANIEKRWGK